MKKLNVKGFTLIELLAVITIMGILMLVAIPTVSRTIENSRKDTFLDTVKQYTNSVKTMWAADNLTCTVDGTPFVSSSAPDGLYLVKVDTSDPSAHPVLLEQGGKSPWGSRDMKGFIVIHAYEKSGSRKLDYYPILVDGVHGVNVFSNGDVFWRMGYGAKDDLKSVDDLKRGSILMSGALYTGDGKVSGTYIDGIETKYSVNDIINGKSDDGAIYSYYVYKENLSAMYKYDLMAATVCVES